METDNEERKCAHVPCNCQAAVDSEYCSSQCAKAFTETDCQCGHDECAAEA